MHIVIKASEVIALFILLSNSLHGSRLGQGLNWGLFALHAGLPGGGVVRKVLLGHGLALGGFFEGAAHRGGRSADVLCVAPWGG